MSAMSGLRLRHTPKKFNHYDKKEMTTDKIRLAIGEHLWNHWTNERDINRLKRAEHTLRSELEQGILPNEFKYHAELELLQRRIRNG